MPVVLKTNLPNLSYRGKVRDIYDLRQWLLIGLAEDQLLMVATDRVSAFDIILPSAIPDKGKVLSLISAFWFEKTVSLSPNHFVGIVNKEWLYRNRRRIFNNFDNTMKRIVQKQLLKRAMIVKKAERIDIECVVRGYLSGSAWVEYKQSGTISGISMPKGLKESDKLTEPLFTPTTKADTGHDQPITVKQMEDLVGKSITGEIMEKSIAVYNYAAQYALSRGIIIADTKMEFGLIGGKLSLIDELLTPDSSRFWDAEKYSPGKPQPSFDKQPLRDWLTESGWNKEPPAPELPREIVEETSKRYREAYRRLTGNTI